MDLARHPGFLIGEHLDALFHSDISNTVLDVRQYCVCERCWVLMVEGIPLCVFEAVLQSGEGILGPGGDGPLCGLFLSTEGGVCWVEEQGEVV